MTSRTRQSAAGPTPRRSGAAELPQYCEPKFPLNPAAQRALAQLTRVHNVQKLDKSIQSAQVTLTQAATDLNDRLRDREGPLKRRKANPESRNGSSDETTELEETVAHFRSRVENMTLRMDESMCKLVDVRHGLQSINESVGTALDHAQTHASTQASTQGLRQQRYPRRGEGDNDEDRMGSGPDPATDGQYPDFMPTDPAASSEDVQAPVETFRTHLGDEKIRYQALSRTARYAENNDYINFRRSVHDAQHPDDDVPLPHPSEWFRDPGAPAPGVTARGTNTEEDSDDDIAVSKATISTKCPLTLQDFKDPLSSKKCPHSFEAQAILQMIHVSTIRVPQPGRRNNERSVQCPVPGCAEVLTKDDLQADPVLVRKIRRIQRAREMEEEDSGSEHGGRPGMQPRRTQTIDDDDDDDEGPEIDPLSVDRRPLKMKSEVQSTGVVPSSMANTQMVDLDDDDDAEEEEEDEMEDGSEEDETEED